MHSRSKVLAPGGLPLKFADSGASLGKDLKGTGILPDVISSLRKLLLVQCASWLDARHLLDIYCRRDIDAAESAESEGAITGSMVARAAYNVGMREQLRITRETMLLTEFARLPVVHVRLEQDDVLREALTNHIVWAAMLEMTSAIEETGVDDPLKDTALTERLAMLHRSLPLPLTRGTLMECIRNSQAERKAHVADTMALCQSMPPTSALRAALAASSASASSSPPPTGRSGATASAESAAAAQMLAALRVHKAQLVASRAADVKLAEALLHKGAHAYSDYSERLAREEAAAAAVSPPKERAVPIKAAAAAALAGAHHAMEALLSTKSHPTSTSAMKRRGAAEAVSEANTIAAMAATTAATSPNRQQQQKGGVAGGAPASNLTSTVIPMGRVARSQYSTFSGGGGGGGEYPSPPISLSILPSQSPIRPRGGEGGQSLGASTRAGEFGSTKDAILALNMGVRKGAADALTTQFQLLSTPSDGAFNFEAEGGGGQQHSSPTHFEPSLLRSSYSTVLGASTHATMSDISAADSALIARARSLASAMTPGLPYQPRGVEGQATAFLGRRALSSPVAGGGGRSMPAADRQLLVTSPLLNRGDAAREGAASFSPTPLSPTITSSNATGIRAPEQQGPPPALKVSISLLTQDEKDHLAATTAREERERERLLADVKQPNVATEKKEGESGLADYRATNAQASSASSAAPTPQKNTSPASNAAVGGGASASDAAVGGGSAAVPPLALGSLRAVPLPSTSDLPASAASSLLAGVEAHEDLDLSSRTPSTASAAVVGESQRAHTSDSNDDGGLSSLRELDSLAAIDASLSVVMQDGHYAGGESSSIRGGGGGVLGITYSGSAPNASLLSPEDDELARKLRDASSAMRASIGATRLANMASTSTRAMIQLSMVGPSIDIAPLKERNKSLSIAARMREAHPVIRSLAALWLTRLLKRQLRFLFVRRKCQQMTYEAPFVYSEDLDYRRIQAKAVRRLQKFCKRVPAYATKRWEKLRVAFASRRRFKAVIQETVKMDALVAPQLKDLAAFTAQHKSLDEVLRTSISKSKAAAERRAADQEQAIYGEWMRRKVHRDWIEVRSADGLEVEAYVNTRSGDRQTEHPNLRPARRAKRQARAAIMKALEADIERMKSEREESGSALRRSMLEVGGEMYTNRRLQLSFKAPPQYPTSPHGGMSPGGRPRNLAAVSPFSSAFAASMGHLSLSSSQAVVNQSLALASASEADAALSMIHSATEAATDSIRRGMVKILTQAVSVAMN